MRRESWTSKAISDMIASKMIKNSEISTRNIYLELFTIQNYLLNDE
jgi:hypothetical protein